MASLAVTRGLLATGALALTLTLAGCEVSTAAKDFEHEVEKEWRRIENSSEIHQLTERTRCAFGKLEDASKGGTAAVQKTAEEAMKTAVRELYAAWHSAMKPLNQPYIIVPKCLLAMAVGSSAISVAGGLSLAALGFATEGVEAGSLAALWQSALGDVEAGSLFSRLQSLGAKGLSTAQKFQVAGLLATISEGFCGIVNSLCHGCLSKAGLEDATGAGGDLAERMTPRESQSDYSVNQSTTNHRSAEFLF